MSWAWEELLLDALAGAWWLAVWLGLGEVGAIISILIASWLCARRHKRALAEEEEKLRRNLKDLFGG